MSPPTSCPQASVFAPSLRSLFSSIATTKTRSKMATFLIFAVLLFAHFVADFVLQPHWMALQKSQKLGVLAMHVSIHLATFFVFGLGVFGQMGPALLLSAINGGLHGLIDWNIW